MRKILYGFIIIILSTSSCKDKTDTIIEKRVIEADKNTIIFKSLESDFMKWWAYHNKNITLSLNFFAENELSEKITKKQFLEILTTGNYIPLKLESKNNIELYKLFRLDTLADIRIRSSIKKISGFANKHFKMEKILFPEFHFTDLNGNIYTNETIKGKTTIFKTWFINCKACVAEFPELNELVARCKNKEDILFVSLATNSKLDLENFLINKTFEYHVVPNQEEFITKQLNLQMYPTHIVVDKNGTIIKVVNNASEMISFLENEKILIKK